MSNVAGWPLKQRSSAVKCFLRSRPLSHQKHYWLGIEDWSQRNTTEANVVLQHSRRGSRLKRSPAVWQERTGHGAIVGYKEPGEISVTYWPTIPSPESGSAIGLNPLLNLAGKR